jgi:YHS domain-containing protein
MTSTRQQRKSRLFRLVRLPLAVSIGLALFGGILTPQSSRAATDDRIVVNANTGLAISGFDPVTYFIDKKPQLGRPEYELSKDGTVWRFLNEGNRAAFSEHPEVYTPRFGGYDPVAIARGASVPGHPLIWAMTGERLYLFYNEKARSDFLANPGHIIESAMRKWSEVARSIGR